jgi:hypothetical protein
VQDGKEEIEIVINQKGVDNISFDLSFVPL